MKERSTTAADRRRELIDEASAHVTDVAGKSEEYGDKLDVVLGKYSGHEVGDVDKLLDELYGKTDEVGGKLSELLEERVLEVGKKPEQLIGQYGISRSQLDTFLRERVVKGKITSQAVQEARQALQSQYLSEALRPTEYTVTGAEAGDKVELAGGIGEMVDPASKGKAVPQIQNFTNGVPERVDQHFRQTLPQLANTYTARQRGIYGGLESDAAVKEPAHYRKAKAKHN
jgi:hypothetical protein|tara:strand:- start:425 stop:1111 length:687 start_codon:yes stop_codon:yes gene_type:complete